MPPFFSIILPTHNRIELLPLAVESVLAQTWTDYELIVVDDGSSKDLYPALQRAESMLGENFLFLRHAENQGCSAARNTALDRAKGEYIVFLDDDDQFMPNLLEALRQSLREENADLIWAGREEVHYKADGSILRKKRVWPSPAALKDRDQLKFATHFALCWGVAVRRAVLREIGGFDASLSTTEDIDFFFRLLHHGARWNLVPQHLVEVHLRHRPSLTRGSVAEANQLRDRQQLIEKNAVFLQKVPHVWKYYTNALIGYHYRLGQRREARRLASALLKKYPFYFRTWENIFRFEIKKPIAALVKNRLPADKE